MCVNFGTGVNTMEFWLAGIVAVLLLIYLVYCLFKAEEL